MDKFNLEQQYNRYLERVHVSQEQLHPTQNSEMKRAFMGACGQMLVLLREDIGGMENEDEAVKALQHLENQVLAFWEEEVKKEE